MGIDQRLLSIELTGDDAVASTSTALLPFDPATHVRWISPNARVARRRRGNRVRGPDVHWAAVQGRESFLLDGSE